MSYMEKKEFLLALRVAAKIAWRVFLAEVRRAAKDLGKHEKREEKDIDGDGGVGTVGGRRIPLAALLLGCALSAGCATYRDGRITVWGRTTSVVHRYFGDDEEKENEQAPKEPEREEK